MDTSFLHEAINKVFADIQLFSNVSWLQCFFLLKQNRYLSPQFFVVYRCYSSCVLLIALEWTTYVAVTDSLSIFFLFQLASD